MPQPNYSFQKRQKELEKKKKKEEKLQRKLQKNDSPEGEETPEDSGSEPTSPE